MWLRLYLHACDSNEMENQIPKKNHTKNRFDDKENPQQKQNTKWSFPQYAHKTHLMFCLLVMFHLVCSRLFNSVPHNP